MARRSVHRRQEFSFPPGGSPVLEAAAERSALPPLAPAAANPMAPRAGEENFRWLQPSRVGSPDSGSGTPSPQLWASHDHHHRLYPASAGSSPSRAQAIAGYRREMLDLVRGLPESAYELSLRDIVESRPSPSRVPPPPRPPPPSHAVAAQEHEADEHKKHVAAAAATLDDEEAKKQSGGGGGGRKQRATGKTRSRSMERSVSLDTGLLIKLFLPLSVGGKKKVSPKPAAAAAAKDGKKKKKQQQGKEEEEWWKKSEFSEAGSSSRTSSTGSSNSSASRNGNGSGNGGSNPKAPARSRSRSRERTGCYGFFRADKSKKGVIQE